MTSILSDLQKIILTLAISLTFGYTFSLTSIPAPFLLGSLFGVWLFGGTIKTIRGNLGIARWAFVPVMLGLGTVIGSNFDPNVIANLSSSLPTVLAMFGATILATSLGMLYLVRLRKYDFYTAFFGCIPGGQAEAVLLSRGIVEKDYIVALFHLVRVALVFLATPIVLGMVQGAEAVKASNITLREMPSILDVELNILIVFIFVSVIGFPIAKLLRIPMPHFIGPVLLSSILHIFGVIELPRLSEFIILAQLVVGGSVGARLAKVPILEISGYLFDAIINSLIVMSVYGISALALNLLIGIDLLKLLLAFIPGGLYEVTLLALIFGFDVAFVAFHHTIRVILVCIGMPVVVTYMKRRDTEKKI